MDPTSLLTFNQRTFAQHESPYPSQIGPIRLLVPIGCSSMAVQPYGSASLPVDFCNDGCFQALTESIDKGRYLKDVQTEGGGGSENRLNLRMNSSDSLREMRMRGGQNLINFADVF